MVLLNPTSLDLNEKVVFVTAENWRRGDDARMDPDDTFQELTITQVFVVIYLIRARTFYIPPR